MYFRAVLTSDVRFEGWTTEAWQRFLHLWKPHRAADREATRPRGGVMAIHDSGALRKLVHTNTGRLDATGAWPIALPDLAAAHHASWALSMHMGSLEEIMERFGARIRRGDDLTTQALMLVSIAREMMDEGAIDLWPRRLRAVPTPTDAVVRRAFDSLCPDGRAMVLGIFKDGELWTSFTARRRGVNFDVIAGPDELRLEMGVLSGDWRRDYRHLARSVEQRYAPLAFGCFAEVDTFRELQIDTRPGAWGRAVAVRDIVLSPIPTAIGMALGVDGARYAFDHLKIVTERIGGPFGLLDPMMAKVRAKFGTAVGDKDVSSTLGFDPLAALRALMRR